MRPLTRRDLRAAAAGRAGGHVERADQPGLTVHVADDLALVEHVIAGGDQVGAGGQELLTERRRDAEAAGGVLGVDDDGIEGELAPELSKLVEQRLAAGASDHVAAEQQPHPRPAPSAAIAGPPQQWTARSVTTASSG